MKKIIPFGFSALATVIASTSIVAHADEYDDISTGYFGIRAGQSYNDHSCSPFAVRCDKDEVGYGVFTGYEFNRVWALELSYNDIGDTEATYPGGIKLDGELTQVDLSLKASWPFVNDSKMYAKVGAAYWEAEVKGGPTRLKDDGVRPLVGVGFEFPMSEHFGTRIEYQYIDDLGSNKIGRADAHYLGIALVWNFTPRVRKVPVAYAPPVEQPRPEPEPQPDRKVVVDEHLGGPLFEFDKAVVRNTGSIEPVVKELLENPSFNVSVTGHTDSRGAADYNQRLSEERANAVAKYLQSRGISSSRITVLGQGESQPAADNSTDEGRARNRRVEFVISGVKKL